MKYIPAILKLLLFLISLPAFKNKKAWRHSKFKNRDNNFNNLDRNPLNNVTCKISKVYTLDLQLIFYEKLSENVDP